MNLRFTQLPSAMTHRIVQMIPDGKSLILKSPGAIDRFPKQTQKRLALSRRYDDFAEKFIIVTEAAKSTPPCSFHFIQVFQQKLVRVQCFR